MPSGDDLVTVVCTDTAPSVNWQVQILVQTWCDVGQPGSFLRLVAAPDGGAVPDHVHARVLCTDAWNVHPDTGDHYPPYNRLVSLREWLDDEQPDASILIVDPDMVFRDVVRTRARPGTGVVQGWYDFHAASDPSRAVAEATGVPAQDLPAVTWPAVLHATDLRRILPRWIELTSELRQRTGAWESDMYAFVGVLAEDGIDLTEEPLTAWMNWPEDVVAGAPIIHYCQVVESDDGTALWSKRDYRPWEPVGADPGAARLDYCRELLTILTRVIERKRGVARGS